MAYYFYLGNTLLPITPDKLTLKIDNKNKTVDLINNTEINILKNPGLTEIEFKALLPNVRYPFALYKNNFQNALYYLKIIEKLKVNRIPFQFIVSRKLPNNKILFDTNMKVSIEEYKISEDAKEGFDVIVDIKLKQYVEYSTKVLETNEYTNSTTNRSLTTTQTDNISNTGGQNYIVKKDDNLWNIAKKFYGDGSQYKNILNANKEKIVNPNLIYPGQVIWIPM